MKIGLNLLFLGATIGLEHLKTFERVREIGYDGVEVSILDGTVPHYRALGRCLSDLGLEATFGAIATPEASPISSDPGVRARALERLRWSIDCGHALGGTVMIGPYHSPLGLFTGAGPTEDEISRCAEVLHQAADYGDSAGIKLSIEAVNRFECYMLNTMPQGSDLRRRVAHRNFSYMYDTFHANIEEENPIEAYSRFSSEITYIHISENTRGIPGRGNIRWRETFAAIRGAGYDDWLTVEAFGRSVPELAAATRVWRDLFPDVETLLVESHDFIRRQWDAASPAT
jgi:D-psicose/D-tagatose/L-ribulose 3-epimerase